MASNKNCQDLNRKPSQNLIKGNISGEKGDVVFRYINGRVVALKAEYADNFTSETQERNGEFFAALHKDSSSLVSYLNASPYAKELGIKYSPQCLAKYNIKRRKDIGKVGFVWYTTASFTEPVLEMIDMVEDAGNAIIKTVKTVNEAIWNNAEVVAISTVGEKDVEYRKIGSFIVKRNVHEYTFTLNGKVKDIAYWAYNLEVGRGWQTVAIQRNDFLNK